MSEALWATYDDGLKLILTGSTSKPLSAEQRGIFLNMLACGMRDDAGNLRKERHLPGIRSEQHYIDEDSQQSETM